MARFIFEVDDDFIRENADLDVAKKRLDPKASGGSVVHALFDLMAFAAIEGRLDKGKTEFLVTREAMSNDVGREFWDRNISDVLMLAFMADHDAQEEQKKEGE